MSKPDFSAIHHVAIIVSDYQKARHFYVDILGLPILREHYRPERHDYKLDLQLKDAELELFAVQDPPIRRNAQASQKRPACVILPSKPRTSKPQWLIWLMKGSFANRCAPMISLAKK